MAFRIDVDRSACIGSGNCVRVTNGAFQLDEEDVAYVADRDAASDDELEQAEASCPTGAIRLSDA
jgi:ferredoxin